ncbi:hypothetical protein ABT56_09880 [Photobacterium aquae]|uniref:Prepilin-type N-terminal cleavage/methylation domain-containing protein n=1 Tax=Photobacterium aquae TaxID=1195763 RepID=A0A0J1H224_9GAMM|nr:type II secretion system protein [Photobacterium aquae]KLV05838.1 hypothetical protein ABT56_09880 [Photobacterium aquae]
MSSKSHQGFTLIELMVVLVLISSMVGFAAPKVWNFYAKRVEQGEVDTVVARIAALKREYRRAGKPLIINQGDYLSQDRQSASRLALVTLPEGWAVAEAEQLRFLVNGVTNGGEVFLQAPSGLSWRIWYRPLDGDVEVSQVYAQ